MEKALVTGGSGYVGGSVVELLLKEGYKANTTVRGLSRPEKPLGLRYYLPYLLPRWTAPNAAVRVLGPFFGLTQDYTRKHLSVRFTLDNRRSIEDAWPDIPASARDSDGSL